MARNYLTFSRHGTTPYFRRRVPDDLRQIIGKSYLIATLGSCSRRVAVLLARAVAARTDSIFQALRMTTSNDDKPGMPPVEIPDSSTLQTLIKQKKRELYLTERFEQEIAEKEALIESERARHRDLELRTRAKLLEQHAALQLAELKALKRDSGGFQGSGAELVSSISEGVAAGLKTASAAGVKDGPTLLEVWNRYKAEKIAVGKDGGKNGWKDGENTALYDYFPHIRDFWQSLAKGESTPITDVTFGDAERFKTVVLNREGASGSNKKKVLQRAGGVFRWAKSAKRLITDDFSEAFKYPSDVPKNSYLKYSDDDLKALFESDKYRIAGFARLHEYWLPLIGLFTGARLNELCQLRASDFSESEGIVVISILDEDDRRLKTTSSRRIVPVHSKLIELGLLDLVKATRDIGKDRRLFAYLPEAAGKLGDFGKEPSRHFTAYRRECGVGALKGKSRKTFHSFRPTLIAALRKAQVPKDRRTRLAGHVYEDEQDTSYDGGDPLDMFSTATLKGDIEKVQYAVDFSRWIEGGGKVT